MFVKNPFGHVCNVCDRLWFLNDLKAGQREVETLLQKITVRQNCILLSDTLLILVTSI